MCNVFCFTTRHHRVPHPPHIRVGGCSVAPVSLLSCFGTFSPALPGNRPWNNCMWPTNLRRGNLLGPRRLYRPSVDICLSWKSPSEPDLWPRTALSMNEDADVGSFVTKSGGPTYTYTYVYTKYIYMYMCEFEYVCIYIYLYINILKYTYICVCKCVCVYICTYMYICVYV